MMQSTAILQVARSCQRCCGERSFQISFIKDALNSRLRRNRVRSKHSKKMMYASMLGGSTLTAGYLVLENSRIGPIYEFESDKSSSLPLDYDIPRMQKYF